MHKGVWHHIGTGEDQLVEDEVAVKSMKSETSEDDKVKFLQEAAIMGQFDHPNIVMIMGILVTESQVQLTKQLFDPSHR